MTKKILVSQPKPKGEKSLYSELEQMYDVEFTFHSFIRIEPMEIVEFRRQHIQLPSYTAIVFTSKFAIEHFFRICKESRYAPPETLKYFAISESVANYIQKFVVYRKRKVFFGKQGGWDGLVEVMQKHREERYLIPLSDVNTGAHLEALKNCKKLTYTPCVIYHTVSNELVPDKLRQYDLVILFTPAGVESFVQSLPKEEQGTLQLATYGEATAAAAENAGLRIDIKAPTARLHSIGAVVEAFLGVGEGEEH